MFVLQFKLEFENIQMEKMMKMYICCDPMFPVILTNMVK